MNRGPLTIPKRGRAGRHLRASAPPREQNFFAASREPAPAFTGAIRHPRSSIAGWGSVNQAAPVSVT